MKVFINPGHDKVYDSGAKNDVLGIRECDIAYVIGALVEKYLNNVGIETKSLQSDNLCNDTNYYNLKSRFHAFHNLHQNQWHHHTLQDLVPNFRW